MHPDSIDPPRRVLVTGGTGNPLTELSREMLAALGLDAGLAMVGDRAHARA